ncbi:MAG: hypothetical protein ACMXYF_00830 [Candidatus Woesearchaeota archaeon]
MDKVLIIVIVAVLSVSLVGLLFFTLGFAYFGVLSPDSFLPDRCYLDSADMTCVEFSRQNNQVILVIQNLAAYPIQITELSYCQAQQQVFEPGRMATLTCDALEDEITINYLINDLPRSARLVYRAINE